MLGSLCCPSGLSIEPRPHWVHDKRCLNSISPLPVHSLIIGSDLPPPDGVLPSGYRNWISGKRNSRMLEFQERFQDAKKNSSVMSRWHHNGRSGNEIRFCLSHSLIGSETWRSSRVLHDVTDGRAMALGRVELDGGRDRTGTEGCSR